MIFKTIITDVKTLGVAIDKINAIMKAQTSLNAMDYSLFGTAIRWTFCKTGCFKHYQQKNSLRHS